MIPDGTKVRLKHAAKNHCAEFRNEVQRRTVFVVRRPRPDLCTLEAADGYATSIGLDVWSVGHPWETCKFEVVIDAISSKEDMEALYES
jgi:hypothetical protein